LTLGSVNKKVPTDTDPDEKITSILSKYFKNPQSISDGERVYLEKNAQFKHLDYFTCTEKKANNDYFVPGILKRWLINKSSSIKDNADKGIYIKEIRYPNLIDDKEIMDSVHIAFIPRYGFVRLIKNINNDPVTWDKESFYSTHTNLLELLESTTTALSLSGLIYYEL
jgi:hypothetical protein